MEIFLSVGMIFLCVQTLSWSLAGKAGAASMGGAVDDTLLMFVGEDLSVLTSASRRPEKASAAPAVADVVDRHRIDRYGYETLAQVLAAQPGFFMNPGERGTVPYLRGVRDGVLFLYDGVPMAVDVTKGLHPLDRELSLQAVKRVEIIRGPASVLWGPDAFAGVVNVVPFSGRDRPGLEAGLIAGSDRRRGGWLSYGIERAQWNAYLMGSANWERSDPDHYTVTQSLGVQEEGNRRGCIDDSHDFEIVGNVQIGDWLRMTGRFSSFKHRFVLHDIGDLSWAGEQESPVSFLKAVAFRSWGVNRFQATAYYERLRFDVTDVDLHRAQTNDIYYGEILWSRPLFTSGDLTVGFSFRDNQVDGAVVEDGFLPDFLKPSNKVFVPEVSQQDFRNSLVSVFAQYRHRWGPVEGWLGLRYDDHSDYRSRISYSMGINWLMTPRWRLKAVAGTAYRSPFSAQLFGGRDFDPEGISTAALQMAWTPDERRSASATLFASRVTDHIAEDPYGGLSLPSDATMWGLEWQGRWRFGDDWEIYGNFSAVDSRGDSEDYRVLKYVFVRPDGSRVSYFDEWNQRFDTGPGIMGNVGISWRCRPKTILSVEGGMTEAMSYSYSRDEVSGRNDGLARLRAVLTWDDFLVPRSRFVFRLDDFFPHADSVPGIYGPAERPSLRVSLQWSWRF